MFLLQQTTEMFHGAHESQDRRISANNIVHANVCSTFYEGGDGVCDAEVMKNR